ARRWNHWAALLGEGTSLVQGSVYHVFRVRKCPRYDRLIVVSGVTQLLSLTPILGYCIEQRIEYRISILQTLAEIWIGVEHGLILIIKVVHVARPFFVRRLNLLLLRKSMFAILFQLATKRFHSWR
ncbi:MAG TPA: hypothetical protein VMV29_16770, partial [Ktedonobacterales bacterium]|nr:hypothetical protein [Ktedonobacterales bacterium]